MTPEEKKIIFKYLENIQSIGNNIHLDREHDSKELFEMYKELMLSVSNLITETKLLNQQIKLNSKNTTASTLQAASAIALETQGLKDIIEDKKILALNPGKINKQRPWYKKLINWWIKGWE